MKIVVPIRFVPDLVEELEIDDSGTALDETWMSMVLSELDEHAIEQAILIKERSSAHVTVLALEAEGCDNVLATAAAQGADRLLRVVGDAQTILNSHGLARQWAPVITELNPDLVLTGVQAHNDLDGQLGPLLAGYLGLPYVGYIAGVAIKNGSAIARKEYPGGLIAEMEVKMPAVLGIQAAEQPPRYVAFSRISQAKKSSTIEERAMIEIDQTGSPVVSRMYQPDASRRATMIEGDVEEIADKILQIFVSQGIS